MEWPDPFLDKVYPWLYARCQFTAEWTKRGVVVKHADSQHRGCQFDSSMSHFLNAIGAGGNGKPPHEIHFRRKKLIAQSLVSATDETEYGTQDA